jgi:hypothetical protein
MNQRFLSPATNPVYIVDPMERHQFVPPGEFCQRCGKLRALHRNDGFVPNQEPPRCSMRMDVRYNRHPYFFKPGDVPEDEFGKGPNQ